MTGKSKETGEEGALRVRKEKVEAAIVMSTPTKPVNSKQELALFEMAEFLGYSCTADSVVRKELGNLMAARLMHQEYRRSGVQEGHIDPPGHLLPPIPGGAHR